MNIPIILLAVILVGCSPEQSSSAVSAVTKSYTESYRDNVIKNYQARVTNAPSCAQFKERFKTVGERYDNASNGAFVNDMMKIWEATKAANCNASV